MKFLKIIGDHAILLGLLAALAATVGSLFMSEVLQFSPCMLCWYQRMFVYPLVPIFAVALGKKDKGVFEYGFVMSVIGAAIAAYQYALQMGVIRAETCGEGLVSCSEKLIELFGFITIPLMSLGMFLVIAGLMVVGMWRRDSSN